MIPTTAHSSIRTLTRNVGRGVVGAIHAAAKTELDRRAAAVCTSWLLQRWAGPTAAVATLIAAVAITVAAPYRSFIDAVRRDHAASEIGVPEAIGFQPPFTGWLEGGGAPAVDELLVAVDSWLETVPER